MATMEKLNIQGLAGSLSCLLLQPETPPVGVAILLHPNPMHGGTNMNKVIQTAAKSLCSLGFLCILPNLRGVGEVRANTIMAEAKPMMYALFMAT